MALLMRHSLRTRLPLLFWAGLGFLFFALANVVLFVDLVILPQHDLVLWRNSLVLAGVVVLLYGLIRTKT